MPDLQGYIIIGLLAVFFYRSWRRVYRPLYLMFHGRYELAASVFEELIPKMHTERMRNTHRYGLANCQHRMGKLDEARETLNQVDPEKLDGNLRAGFEGLKGTNLLLGEGDLTEARQHLEAAHSRTKLSSGSLALAYCEQQTGNPKRAEELVESYLRDPSGRKKVAWGFRTILISDKIFSECMSNFFLGSYFLKKGDSTRAGDHFRQAMGCKYPNVYAERAARLLREA